MADDIGRWIEDLGLSEKADVFAENEIDSIVLPDLSEADFEKIGIREGLPVRGGCRRSQHSRVADFSAPGRCLLRFDPQLRPGAEGPGSGCRE